MPLVDQRICSLPQDFLGNHSLCSLRSSLLLFSSIFSLLCVGCGGSGAASAVEGTVTFRGDPIQKGAIRFVADGEVDSAGGIGSITDGHYQLPESPDLKAGSYVVAIYGFQETGRTFKPDDNSPELPEEKQYLPREHNDASTHRIELKPGENSLDFHLK